MHCLRLPQLPHAERNARRRTVGAKEVLPQRAQAHPAQRIQEEVRNLEERFMKALGWRERGLVVSSFHDSSSCILQWNRRGVAQLVEHWSPKPAVERSSRSAPVGLLRCLSSVARKCQGA